jgi:glycosyltransferase involved in cell wall biosynthesis
MKKVVIEMEKLRNLNSGLGQSCLHLGQAMNVLPHPDLKIIYQVPKNCVGIFGPEAEYKKLGSFDKIIPVKSSDIDVWHCTHQQSKILPASKKTKMVLTINDLNFLEKYKSISKQKRKIKKLQKLVDRASVVTAISEYTKKIAIENLDLKNKPFQVIYLGNSLKPVENVSRPEWLPDGPYIFSIGIINPKKNFHVLVPLLKKFPQLNLVIAGDSSHDYALKIKAEAKNEGLEERLFLPGMIDDETRYALYNYCEAFAFPSLSEGFGLPVIEAMSLGKPVFLSEYTSLKEVGGTEAFYWNNFEPSHMAEVYEKGMKEFSSDSTKRDRLKNWAAKFSWEETARKLLEVYRSL